MRSIRILSLLMVCLCGRTALAEPQQRGAKKEKSPYKIETLKKGTSSWLTLREAKKAVPLQRLGQQQRQRASEILKSVNHFRQLPRLRFEVEPSVYQFFTTHPDAAVSIWRVMDISKFQMTETSPRVFEADAGDGSRGVSDILYQSPTECVLICDGIYKNPLLLKPILAKGLVHLTTSYAMTNQQKPSVTHQASVFIMFPQTTVKTAAKVISPITNSIMDRNFHEVSVFVQMMSMAMQRQPAWVQKIVTGMDGVDRARQAELMTITRQVRSKANRMNISQSMVDPPVSVEELTRPLVELPLSEATMTAQLKDAEAHSEKSADGAGRVRLSSGTGAGSVHTAVGNRQSNLPVIMPRLLSDSQKQAAAEQKQKQNR